MSPYDLSILILLRTYTPEKYGFEDPTDSEDMCIIEYFTHTIYSIGTYSPLSQNKLH